MNVRQFRDLVVRPTLAALDLPGGLVAEKLVLGTAAQESDGLECLAQLGGGPALGLYQMEPATFRDLWDRYLPGHTELLRRVQRLLAPEPEPLQQLVSNLRFATAMCRIRYLERPFRMPLRADVGILANLWKYNYNTLKGAGTVEEFERHYARYVATIY
jgi:hypothetical protein